MIKWIIVSISLLMTFVATQADFIYQDIDPICSISGTTHTYSPNEISDTSSWYIPKAYDWVCQKVTALKTAEKKIIASQMLDLLERRWYIKTSLDNEHTLTSTWQTFVQYVFFPAIADYIAQEVKKPEPNTRSIAILNYAVSTIGYDYRLNLTVIWDDYIGLSIEDARQLAEENGSILRVVKQDGEEYIVTLDYLPGRVNVEIKNNIVIDYSIE